MAEAAILNFGNWIGYSYLNQIRWADASRPRGDEYMTRSYFAWRHQWTSET